jgi:RHS repeat-associated protein
MAGLRASLWLTSGHGGGRSGGRRSGGRRWARGLSRAGRRAVALVMAPVTAAGVSLVPVTAAAVAGAGVITVASAAVAAAPAKAATGTVLILSTSVNGGTASAEARAVPSGYMVTVATPATWDAMTQAQFKTYSAIIIGDPSTTSCSTVVPPDALSTAATWGPAVTGNVAVLGTAPALAASAGTSLISDAISYAVAGSGTGVYVSLNCEYSTASARTAVPLLASVDGGGFTVTGQGSSCANSGTVNTLQADELSQFSGLTGSALGPWASPACSVQESFNAWPAALSGVAYDKGVSPASFTASDGVTGQPYVLAGAAASAATQALAPSAGGEVPAGSATGGLNPAAPAVSQATAGDPVNTENGDFTQSDTDVSVATFGPSLGLTRTYDAQLAQRQTQAGTPGPMGYGWTDNWASSLTTAKPVPGSIYTLDGLQTATGQGGAPTSAPLNGPESIYTNNSASPGNVYIVDTQGNRIEEVPSASGTQWGQPMIAGKIYTIAGSDIGVSGASGNGTAAGASRLDSPQGVAIDSAGDLFIADTGNSRVVEIAAASGTQWGSPGISMTVNDLYTVAGRTGQPALGTDAKAATASDLNMPTAVTSGPGADNSLYIADAGNNRVQEVAATAQAEWGQSMVAGDVYTVAGSATGIAGDSGDGSNAHTVALLQDPQGAYVSSTGDLFIADTANSRIQEVPVASGAQWGITPAFTANDMYTVAGSATGATGSGGDGAAATSAKLDFPVGVRTDNSRQLYIADQGNSRVQEVARTAHTEWGQVMAVGDIYTIAGSKPGNSGHSGDGGPATSAFMDEPGGIAMDASLNLYVADTTNNEVREVSASTASISDWAGGVGEFAQEGDGGVATAAGLAAPSGVASDAAGDVFVADTSGNRVQEIAAASHIQFGITMTAGDVYTVAGQQGGYDGTSGDGGPAISAQLSGPEDVALDSAGDLYIADTQNNRIQKVSAATGNISTIAGSAAGAPGLSGNGGPATSALMGTPYAIAVDAAGDVFLADTPDAEVREVPAVTGGGMTAGDIYDIAGSATGVRGDSGDGGLATSALLDGPAGLGTDPAGNIYISDSNNNRIQEIAGSAHTQWGQPMTAGDIYTIAGSAAGTSGNGGDGGPASAATLDSPGQIAVDASGDLYIAAGVNNRVREVPAASGTQWGQSMTAGDIYNVAGSKTGTSGETGDGGPATAALLSVPTGVTTDPAGDLFITDNNGTRLREVTATASPTFAYSPPAGGITVTQPGSSQITFYPQSGGNCTAPYVKAGGYCALPQYVGATLTDNISSQTYTFGPQPGVSYTYGWNGALTGESDSAGNTLSIAYGTPAPGVGNCPATAFTCETITSASGRTLVLGSSQSHLTSVTDPLGRRVWYTYTSPTGVLQSVSDPMGNITSYTYGAGSTGNPLLANGLLTITGPNAQPGGPDAGDATVNVYNSAGQVTSQTDPARFQTTYNYCVNATAGDCMNTSTGNGLVTLNDSDANSTVYQYQQGVLAAQSALTGSVLTSEQDYGPDLAADGTSSAGTLLDTVTADGNGKLTTYSYDTAGNLAAATAPDGVGSQTATTTAQFTVLAQDRCDGTGQATSPCSSSQTGPAPVAPAGVISPPSAAPPQGVTYNLYDTDGNQLYSTTGVYEPGSTTASYQPTTYQLFKGNSVTLGSTHITCTATPPSTSLPCATINADGVVTQLAYDPQGDLTSSSMPDGNGTEMATTSYGYDGDGEQNSMVAPDGNLAGANAGNYTTITAYNFDGQKTSVTQAGGTGATATPRLTSYGHDADGNQTTSEDARGFTTTTAYNADDRQALVTDPSGNATLTCYDGDGNTTEVVPPAGVAANSLTSASCPSSYPSGYGDRLAADATTYTFDASDNQISTTTPAPAGQSGHETTTVTYDGAGNVTKTTAPPASGSTSQVTVDTYNSAGQQATQTTGFGTTAAATTSYCHDPNGDNTSVVAPDGNTSGTAACETSSPWVISSSSNPTQAGFQTTAAYDSTGEMVSTTSPATAAAPSGAASSETYDPAGNVLTSTDPDGITTTWTYTPGNLKSGVTYSGSSAHSLTYAYDADGQMTGMTDGTGSSSYLDDPFGELISARNGAGQTTGYGYDADGNPAGITYPLPASAAWATSDTVTYGFDHADRLNSVTDFNGNKITVGDTADGLPNSLGLAATGDTISTTYDQTDVPSAITLTNGSSTLQSFAYSDAPSGAILTETDTPSSPQSPAAYGYDARSRVTSMTAGTSAPLNYSFDAGGNLTMLPNGASGSYDKAGELTSAVVSGTTTSYAYSADGERLTAKQGSATLASGIWNGARELTAYGDAAASMSAATYDGNGLRASTTTTPTGGSATTENFTWNLVTQTPQLLLNSDNAFIYADGNTPAEQVSLSTGAASYLVADSLGSVRGISSSSGSLTATTSYDGFGNPETGGGLTSHSPFGFAGAYTDPTGLIYLINRYYDPATGQFTALDPAVAQTRQPYEYAGGNPVSDTDPTGLMRIFKHWTHVDLKFTLLETFGIYFASEAKDKIVEWIRKYIPWIDLYYAILLAIIHHYLQYIHIVAEIAINETYDPKNYAHRKHCTGWKIYYWGTLIAYTYADRRYCY